MRAAAVIGANYGDEGKGRTVDWLAAPHGPAAVVVRSNGGAQAGHTVATAAGQRHVFHHFGSGSLRGARTHLSRFMVSHPILFAAERCDLARLTAVPRVTADPRGWVTTPWDMMVNQAVETQRGGARHGSCGLGFGETVGRGEETPFALTVGDLARDDLPHKLAAIRDAWLPARLGALALDPAHAALAHATSPALMDNFLDDCRAFAAHVALRDDADLAGERAVIFEAAQGLLLDRNAAGFPFLTRSVTGLANIVAIAAEAGIAEIEPYYVTRCYLTRHGRGPMLDEREIAPWYAVDDPTNRPNPWQETLRFGLLDPAGLAARIADDLKAAGPAIADRARLVVTCLDQARDELAWLDRGQRRRGSRHAFIDRCVNAGRFAATTTFASPFNEVSAFNMQSAVY